MDELNNKQYMLQVSNCYVITDPALNCKYIRSISDNPNGKNQITFDEYLKIASKRCAIIINELLK